MKKQKPQKLCPVCQAPITHGEGRVHLEEAHGFATKWDSGTTRCALCNAALSGSLQSVVTHYKSAHAAPALGSHLLDTVITVDDPFDAIREFAEAGKARIAELEATIRGAIELLQEAVSSKK